MNGTTINSYLTFNGNCREAMQFYKECLGGELHFQTVGESPLSATMPVKMKDCIVQSTLTNEAFTLIGSDMVDDKGLVKGNAVSLLLVCNSEEEVNNCYAKLASGGEATHPPTISYWGSLFGDLIDKFGNQWMLNYQTKK
ncbi:MAG: VOC family protein [Chitinophagaceae bacterium]